MIKFIYQITKEGLPMSQDSLDELFSSNPEFEASCKAISSAVERSINSICVSNIDGISEALALSADCLSRLGDVFPLYQRHSSRLFWNLLVIP